MKYFNRYDEFKILNELKTEKDFQHLLEEIEYNIKNDLYTIDESKFWSNIKNTAKNIWYGGKHFINKYVLDEPDDGFSFYKNTGVNDVSKSIAKKSDNSNIETNKIQNTDNLAKSSDESSRTERSAIIFIMKRDTNQLQSPDIKVADDIKRNLDQFKRSLFGIVFMDKYNIYKERIVRIHNIVDKSTKQDYSRIFIFVCENNVEVEDEGFKGFEYPTLLNFMNLKRFKLEEDFKMERSNFQKYLNTVDTKIIEHKK